MSVAAFMVRLLICLGLLVNGSAQAVAATQSALASHQAEAAMAPCDEDGDSHFTGPQVHEHRMGPASDNPDCCKSRACDCACSHGAVATMPALHAPGRNVAHETRVNRFSTCYASPALPRLIRPPIV